MLNAEVTPHDRHRHLDLHRRGRRRAHRALVVGRDPFDARVVLLRPDPLRDDVVEVRDEVRRGLGGHPARAAAGPRPSASHVMAVSVSGYTTNLPLADVTDGKAWIVWQVDGEPLPVEHGGPVRMIVPHLYFWKSTKWVGRATGCMDHDEPGFWERNGYHDRGDPWLEQRYQGD